MAFMACPAVLFWPDCRQPVVHEMRAVAVASWVIYAILGVLVLLIVWRVLREWKHTTDEAGRARRGANGTITLAPEWRAKWRIFGRHP
jgi:membrane protein implicated in regulation of membrane protease activity